jgi:hypothetical protein
MLKAGRDAAAAGAAAAAAAVDVVVVVEVVVLLLDEDTFRAWRTPERVFRVGIVVVVGVVLPPIVA